MVISRTEVADGVMSDREEPADLRLGIVPHTRGVVIDIGSVGKCIGSWRQLPIVLQDLPNQRLLRFDVGECEQCHEVIKAELHTRDGHLVHDVKDYLCHIYFQTRAVVPDYLIKSLRMDVFRRKPHTALLLRTHLPMPEIEEKCGNLSLELLQKESVITLQVRDLAHPISSLFLVNNDWVQLVVGAKHELGKELYFLTILALSLHLVGLGCGQVLQTLRILTAREKYLVNNDEQLTGPVSIELTAEVLVGVEGGILLKDCLQKVEKVVLPVLRSSETSRRMGSFCTGFK